jgi:hypothetical protein
MIQYPKSRYFSHRRFGNDQKSVISTVLILGNGQKNAISGENRSFGR